MLTLPNVTFVAVSSVDLDGTLFALSASSDEIEFADIKLLTLKFPSPELAAQFSVEFPDAAYGQNPETSFGFHGRELRDRIFGLSEM